jgi:hypothetical protein
MECASRLVWSKGAMRSSALIIAHPGHEVRVFGWYEQARPHVFLLASGSRSGDQGRLSLSHRLAAMTGATPGSLFGDYLDRQIYAAVLARDATPFAEWTNALTDALAALAPHLLVTDGWQMYNVMHDLVHIMARVAARRAAERLKRPIEIVQYEVAPRALSAALPLGEEAFRIELDDAAMVRKQSAAAEHGDLANEMNVLLSLEGKDAQRTEIYQETVDIDLLVSARDIVPPYERYGADRVAAGIYRECIRWNDHVRPIVETIRRM